MGELKSIKMVIQLANRSTRLPRGAVEDVSTKVGDSVVVVLETEKVDEIAS